jgi:hypothetical protein
MSHTSDLMQLMVGSTANWLRQNQCPTGPNSCVWTRISCASEAFHQIRASSQDHRLGTVLSFSFFEVTLHCVLRKNSLPWVFSRLLIALLTPAWIRVERHPNWGFGSLHLLIIKNMIFNSHLCVSGCLLTDSYGASLIHYFGRSSSAFHSGPFSTAVCDTSLQIMI